MQKEKRFIIGILVGWVLFNVIQAVGMELDPDEAYYWLYSRQLDWGYFDHPPVIALLIKFGYAIFPNELGVRLGAIILQAAGFMLIWDMLGRPLERQKLWLLVLLLAGLPMLQVYGFIATPDSPLLFFVILFFYMYQRFLEWDSWGNTLILGLVMALMLYSKYHGVLVILFTLLSNWRLLLRPRFYWASIFGALLFLPHLYWQYDQGFPSFSYHLVGRDDIYELKHTVTYLVNQGAILSPLLFPLFILVLIRRRPQDMLERAFYFVIYGFWIFFFFSTFKGHAEPQWTAIISIPLVFLTYRHALAFPRFALWFRRMAIATIVLLFTARLFLLVGGSILPNDFQDQRWITKLQERAGGKAVIFQNSYRDVSKYSFHTRERAYTFTDVMYRKNQFDIWRWEAQLHGQAVLMTGKREWDCVDCERFKHFNKDFKLKEVPEMVVAQKLYWDWEPDVLQQLREGEKYVLEVRITNPYEHEIVFEEGEMPVRPVVYLLEKGVLQETIPLEIDFSRVPASTTISQTVRFSVPAFVDWAPGVYQIGIGITQGGLPPVVSGKIGEVEYK